MLEVKGVFKQFNVSGKAIDVLNDISMSIDKSSFSIIEGVSGCGKSTLLNIIAGIETPTKGEVVKDTTFTLSYAPQQSYFIDEYSVKENLELVANKHGTRKKVSELLERFDCLHLLKSKPFLLSGGEKQRINILRAFLSSADLVILDEPTASLDFENKHKVCQTIQELSRSSAVLLVTHDFEVKNYFKQAISYSLKNGVLT